MPNISREIKAGMVAVITIIGFVWGFNYLKGSNILDKSRHFYAEYKNVQGLDVSAPVTINGLRVGSIDKIYFNPEKRGSLMVEFSLQNDYQFSKNSVAQIYSPDFISGKSIKILPDYEGQPAVSGDTLTGNIDVGILGTINDQIAPLQKKVQSFVENADSLLISFNQVFDTTTKANIKESTNRLKIALGSFNEASRSINSMLAEGGKIDSVLNNAVIVTSDLTQIADSLKQARIAQTINRLDSTLQTFNSILNEVQEGDGSLGKLLKDEGLYNNLEGASKEMEKLLQDLRLNPKRYVHFSLFGKKPKPYQPEASDSLK
ncbi:MAG: MCE family protein [Flavobacteriaceae bacterium]|nr:MCE family protein [Flavobacteriaceae bacterium]